MLLIVILIFPQVLIISTKLFIYFRQTSSFGIMSYRSRIESHIRNTDDLTDGILSAISSELVFYFIQKFNAKVSRAKRTVLVSH